MQGRVLIVENDPTVSRLAYDFLRYDGHEVTLANDGEEGLRVFSTGEFDVVLTDVKMPKMDGIQMMKAIKTLDPSVEVIVFTGYGTFEMTIDVIRNGGYDFLRKPDDVAQRIRPTVTRAIEKRRMALKNQELLRALEDANTDLQARVREKNQEARRLAAQHAITRILAETTTLSQAAGPVLTTLLDTLGWSFGAFWRIDRYTPIMKCVEVVHTGSADMEAFATKRRSMTVEIGQGLPGQVWASRRHAFDLTGESYRKDSGAITLNGLVFPILIGETVAGAIEFCGVNLSAPEETILQMLGVIAAQLGLFFERERLAEQVLQAQKMEAIGRLAGGIAHDFNNLLTSIIGYAHLIEKRIDPDSPMHRNALQIQKTGHRASALIQQLLAFSRRQVMKSGLLSLNDVFSNLDNLLERLLQDNIKIDMDLDPKLHAIFADQTQIEQVIINLAVNARDAMPSGGVLRFETANETLDEHQAVAAGVQPGIYSRLTVSDTGTGMDDIVQSHLFEPFFTTKETGKGSGLGLATVYGIITQSGGQIQVKSVLGQGTTFNIYLPISKGNEASVGSSIYVPPQARAPEPTRGSEKILLVEDQDDLRDIARQILQQAGYTVLDAANGVDGLALFHRNAETVDLVVTDVVMPLMNGDELAQRLIQTRPTIRVVFITGYADETLIQHNVFGTGIPLLEKPFAPNDLLAVIREELDAPRPSHLPDRSRNTP